MIRLGQRKQSGVLSMQIAQRGLALLVPASKVLEAGDRHFIRTTFSIPKIEVQALQGLFLSIVTSDQSTE